MDCFSEGQACWAVVLSKKARNKHEELIQKIAIKKDGYIETYLVNETAENVWFDQFRIMSTGPLIVQETHYDPYGVELSGIGYQYGGIKVNPYLYNGKELTSGLGVIMYDYGARLYIPAIGKWFVPDPLAEKARRQSPYNYALNNSLRFIDPDGMEAYSVQERMGGTAAKGRLQYSDGLVKAAQKLFSDFWLIRRKKRFAD
ncbi:MAG: RHS repeat domain-containing protein [Algoriphagus aquaeductus]|uniref:RHS repeat domain-containing protein n=1 Tax=Algoriphagus aquaeductus TaxID=475299 RepID=UPI00391CCC06